MKIATWNVNGLRSAVSSGFEDWLQNDDPDIVCLQETKMLPDMLTTSWFNGYSLEIFPAVRSGYAGTGILYKRELGSANFSFGIGVDEFDKEGRVCAAEFDDLEVISVYAPHSHRELINLDKKKRFGAALFKFLKQKMSRSCRKPIVLAGDLNVAYEERDVYHFKNNRGNAGFHEAERAWFASLLKLGLVDALREVTDAGGIYSWWSLLPEVREKNIGWRLDYILAEKRLSNKIVDCYHSVDSSGSDHCPVTVALKDLAKI